jgi:hypothetical protein
MNSRFWIGVIVSALLASSWVLPDTSSAVPSFARQTGKSCSGCHTIWPRLNATGREFKLTGYTDIAEDYPRIEKDTLELLRQAPLSISIISLPYSRIKHSDATGERSETLIPDEVAVFYAGRITPNVGAFLEPVWSKASGVFELEFAKLAVYTRWGKNTVGIAGGKMDVGGADPYNTIRFTAYHTINQPAIFSQPDALSGTRDFFSFVGTTNQGVVLNGKFFQTIYAAVGGFRGHASDDPGDGFGRLAAEFPIGGEANIMVGGFYLGGQERYEIPPIPSGLFYEGKFMRSGADLQFQMESGTDIIDVIGVYMGGEDKDLDNTPGLDIKFRGYYAEASYFYERTYGITAGYDHVSSAQDHDLDKKGPTLNVSYLPWLNTKLAIEYSVFELANDVKERDCNFLVHLYF